MSEFLSSYRKSAVRAAILLTALACLYLISNINLGGRDMFGTEFPELRVAVAIEGGFGAYAPYFKNLADDKGAVYAFEVLKRVQLAPNTDLHLLGHIVGDELYKQKGIKGIESCTDDFRNACSHSIVVGALIEFGESALPKISDACKKAPGGKGAYTMCFHGLGHGILAYFEYELPQTVKFCEKVGTKEYNNREYIECVGGAIMESISGGGHDRETWQRVTQKYFKKGDPLYPCNADFMPDVVRPQCFTYLTPHLFRSAGADLGYPTPDNFRGAFRFCEAIPKSDKENRSRCFGGFGKEFVVLAQDRDIRRIEDMTDDQLNRVASWCSLANDEQGILDCDIDSVQSLFWGGENEPDAALTFCGVIPEGPRASSCFSELTSAVSFYISDSSYRESICNRYPALYKDNCVSSLLLPGD